MPHFDEVAPILSVRDLTSALEHYRRLGFEVSSYDGSYGYARHGDVHLHLAAFDDLDPATSNSAAYLYVDDADRLYEQWRDAGIGGRLREPADTPYGLREGAHVDPDGNLLRFGSRLRTS